MRCAHFVWVCLAIASSVVPLASAQEPALGELAARTHANASDPEAFAAYGRALVRAGRYDDAVRALHRATQLRRNAPDALYEEASVAFARGDYRAARTACRPLEARGRSTVWAHICRARAFLVLNRSASAFDELARALALDPRHYEARLALGDAHRIRMDLAEAESHYRVAAEIVPNAAGPHLGLGRALAAAGRRDEAIAELRQAVALDPTWPDAQHELGALLDGDEGLALLEAAVTGRPGWAHAQVALGEARLARGRTEGARAAFEAAMRLDPGLAQAQVGLGRALAAQGHDSEAERTLLAALERVPSSSPALVALAEIAARTERYEEAYEHYRRAADGNPGDPAPLLAAARLALAHDRDVLAAAFLDRVLGAHPDDAEGLALYGDVMRARREVRDARSFYEQALAAPGPLDRDRVRRALQSLPR